MCKVYIAFHVLISLNYWSCYYCVIYISTLFLLIKGNPFKPGYGVSQTNAPTYCTLQTHFLTTGWAGAKSKEQVTICFVWIRKVNRDLLPVSQTNFQPIIAHHKCWINQCWLSLYIYEWLPKWKHSAPYIILF